jgi:hypothetical protein
MKQGGNCICDDVPPGGYSEMLHYPLLQFHTNDRRSGQQLHDFDHPFSHGYVFHGAYYYQPKNETN